MVENTFPRENHQSMGHALNFAYYHSQHPDDYDPGI
jgi:hypothetical protein